MQSAKVWVKDHKWLSLTAAVSAIVLIALVVAFILALGDTKKPVNRANPQSNKKTIANEQVRLAGDYKRVKAQIARAVTTNRMTQAQADELTKKIDELYDYRRQLTLDTPAAHRKLQQKRLEWRQWAQAHNVSPSYFNWLY